MKIGLALSGGGALGAAHIGVLEELEAHNIVVARICGTSAGAIVGLLYASGGLKAITRFYEEIEKAGLFNRSTIVLHRNSTIFKKVHEALRHCVKEESFGQLKTKFSCVATNLTSGEPIILNSGDPVNAVMASSAYPGVFPVQKIGFNYLIDGGLTHNLPASVLREKGYDFVIGSSLYSVAKFEKFDSGGNPKTNPLGVALRSLDIIQKGLAEYEISNCDFCFQPEVHSFSWYNFDQIAEIKNVGKKHAEAAVVDLIAELAKRGHPKSFWQKLFNGE